MKSSNPHPFPTALISIYNTIAEYTILPVTQLCINILLQSIILIFILPNMYYPAFILFVLIIISGLSTIFLASFNTWRDSASKSSQKKQRVSFAIMLVLTIIFLIYYLDHHRAQNTIIKWQVSSYRYGSYNSAMQGFDRGWPSGIMDETGGKRKTIGAIGFSFRKDRLTEQLIPVALNMRNTFQIDYAINHFILFCIAFEDMTDRELSDPQLAILQSGNGTLYVDPRKFAFYTPPGGTTVFKHLKINYNARIGNIDYFIAKLLNQMGLGKTVMEIYMTIR